MHFSEFLEKCDFHGYSFSVLQGTFDTNLLGAVPDAGFTKGN